MWLIWKLEVTLVQKAVKQISEWCVLQVDNGCQV